MKVYLPVSFLPRYTLSSIPTAKDAIKGDLGNGHTGIVGVRSGRCGPLDLLAPTSYAGARNDHPFSLN